MQPSSHVGLYEPAPRTETGNKALIQLTAHPNTISAPIKPSRTCACVNVRTIQILILSKLAKKKKEEKNLALFFWLGGLIVVLELLYLDTQKEI